MIPKNTNLTSINNITYTVNNIIGSGGQGVVYKVYSDNTSYALKWYYKNNSTSNQLKILKNLLLQGSPDNNFLWPLDIIIKDNNFGYVMDLRPNNYCSIIDLMKRKSDPTFISLCKGAINLCNSFKKLHSKGYSYHDISFGNIFINPNSGEILICDNDNVTINGSNIVGVYGTPRFMAPEIVRGESPPSTETDLYSLSVLLFYLFFLHHPLEGKIEANIKCLDINAINKIYGFDPIFIFDPNNTSNFPVKGYQDNALIYWSLYPNKFKNNFIQAFTNGLKNPKSRLVENQWISAFFELQNSIIFCQNCSVENFYDSDKIKSATKHSCWNCHSDIILPPRIKVNSKIIMLNKNSILTNSHFDQEKEAIIAKVDQHPNDQTKWGLKNVSNIDWTFSNSNGTIVNVSPGKTVPLVNGLKINFGNNIGEIKI